MGVSRPGPVRGWIRPRGWAGVGLGGGKGSSQQAQSWCGGACWSVSCGPCLAPVTVGSAVSRDSDIFSQMTSTRRSKVCLTLMLSLALASKNSKPVGGEGRGEDPGPGPTPTPSQTCFSEGREHLEISGADHLLEAPTSPAGRPLSPVSHTLLCSKTVPFSSPGTLPPKTCFLAPATSRNLCTGPWQHLTLPSTWALPCLHTLWLPVALTGVPDLCHIVQAPCDQPGFSQVSLVFQP